MIASVHASKVTRSAALFLGVLVLALSASTAAAIARDDAVKQLDADGGFRVELSWDNTADGDEVTMWIGLGDLDLSPPDVRQLTDKSADCKDGKISARETSADYLHSRFQLTEVDVWIHWQRYCDTDGFDSGETMPYRLTIYQLPEFVADESAPAVLFQTSGNYTIQHGAGQNLRLATVEVTPVAARTESGGSSFPWELAAALAGVGFVGIGVRQLTKNRSGGKPTADPCTDANLALGDLRSSLRKRKKLEADILAERQAFATEGRIYRDVLANLERLRSEINANVLAHFVFKASFWGGVFLSLAGALKSLAALQTHLTGRLSSIASPAYRQMAESMATRQILQEKLRVATVVVVAAGGVASTHGPTHADPLSIATTPNVLDPTASDVRKVLWGRFESLRVGYVNAAVAHNRKVSSWATDRQRELDELNARVAEQANRTNERANACRLARGESGGDRVLDALRRTGADASSVVRVVPLAPLPTLAGWTSGPLVMPDRTYSMVGNR